MPTATHTLNPMIAQVPALLELVARTCRREADDRLRGLEFHLARPSGSGYDVVRPAERLAEAASILDDTAGDLRGTLRLLEVNADDEADAGVLEALRGAVHAADDARATLGVLCDAGVSLILGPARSPTPAEERAVAQARAVHGLIQNDPAMPASLRSRLVTYAGLLLDREERAVALTPAGLAALERAEAAGAA
jgi:hypothetical protein